MLFTSFEHRRTLAARARPARPGLRRGAGALGHPLAGARRRGAPRRRARTCSRQIPVLWIWDNVEPVAGFPAGAESAWSVEEQRELADFLRDARETQAKFLLTSRRDERGWLGDLPARVELPSMPMQERVQLARALAERHGRRIADVEDWRPLLRFTQRESRSPSPSSSARRSATASRPAYRSKPSSHASAPASPPSRTKRAKAAPAPSAPPLATASHTPSPNPSANNSPSSTSSRVSWT